MNREIYLPWRDIKFRCWDGERMDYNPMTELEGYDGNRANLNNSILKNREWAEVTPMQYTGLKDKNGKEIYEGDIVWCPDLTEEQEEMLSIWDMANKHGLETYPHTLCVVEYSNLGGYLPFVESQVFHDQVVVVGNIYENPELIKE